MRFSIKWFMLSLFILTMGNWLHWNGRSISEIVKITMAPLENHQFLASAQKWAGSLTQDAKKGILNKVNESVQSAGIATKEEEASPSERQKLKTLIRELSSSEADKE
jgi:hypothetical protein